MGEAEDATGILVIIGSLTAVIICLLCACANRTSSWVEECDYCKKSFMVSDKGRRNSSGGEDDNGPGGGGGGESDLLSVAQFRQHINECFEEHKDRLSRRPAEAGVVCPLCTGPMLLAGLQEINKFYCQAGDPPCPASGTHGERFRFRNDATNCYACVPCNYTLCADCMNRRIRGSERRAQLESEARQARLERQRRQGGRPSDTVVLLHDDSNHPSASSAQSVPAAPPSYDEVVKQAANMV